MKSIKIDGQRVEVSPGETVLEVARRVGVEIPTLCHLEGFESGASCMVCAVRMEHNGQFIPSCGSQAVDGMAVESSTDEVRSARRMALELLFSDHLGDCLSPCQRICPAQLGIPAVLKHVREGEMGLAAGTVRHDLALAGILCRVCHRPCESGCRRGAYDESVAIADLVNHAVECEGQNGSPRVPFGEAEREESVAIVGSGFTGLSAAWYLRQQGFRCTVIEAAPVMGHSIGEAFPEIPGELLKAELELLETAGVTLRAGEGIVSADDLERLLDGFSAVVLAVGPVGKMGLEGFKLGTKGERLLTDPESMMTTKVGVFGAGKVARSGKAPVNSVAEGRAVAQCIQQFLEGGSIRRPPKPFSCFIGKVDEGEMTEFLKEVNPEKHVPSTEVDLERAIRESHRCVKCNCPKIDSCKLRDLAMEYGANITRFSKGERSRFHRNTEHPLVVFEPGKCIRCGNCIKVASEYREELGLTFIGRGFDVHVGVPFHGTMEEGLSEAAKAAVAACPVGALALKDSW